MSYCLTFHSLDKMVFVVPSSIFQTIAAELARNGGGNESKDVNRNEKDTKEEVERETVENEGKKGVADEERWEEEGAAEGPEYSPHTGSEELTILDSNVVCTGTNSFHFHVTNSFNIWKNWDSSQSVYYERLFFIVHCEVPLKIIPSSAPFFVSHIPHP